MAELGGDGSLADGEEKDAGESDPEASSLPGQRPHRLVDRRLVELVASFRRLEPPDDDMKEMKVDARFVAPRALGHLRLWSGMVLANCSWRLFRSFKGTLAAAFATAAYVLVVPTIWMLTDSVGWARLLALMVAAIVAMIVWIIVTHHLWERPSDREAGHWVALYNGVTALTISVAVVFAYTVLFILVLVAAAVFVPEATSNRPSGIRSAPPNTWLWPGWRPRWLRTTAPWGRAWNIRIRCARPPTAIPAEAPPGGGPVRRRLGLPMKTKARPLG